MSMTFRVLSDVAEERVIQDLKWGSQRQLPDGTWALILGEKFGEAFQAALTGGMGGKLTDKKVLRKELIQVAAVAVAWIEAIDRRDLP